MKNKRRTRKRYKKGEVVIYEHRGGTVSWEARVRKKEKHGGEWRVVSYKELTILVVGCDENGRLIGVDQFMEWNVRLKSYRSNRYVTTNEKDIIALSRSPFAESQKMMINRNNKIEELFK